MDRKKIDQRVAMNFVGALGPLVSLGTEPRQVSNPRPAMFIFGPPSDDAGFADLSLRQGMDLVRLEFRPGREHKGPSNIAIYEERQGELRTWSKCFLYAYLEQGVCLIAVDGHDIAFAYDGASLFPIRGLPQDRLGLRISTARSRLREAARRLPLGSVDAAATRH